MCMLCTNVSAMFFLGPKKRNSIITKKKKEQNKETSHLGQKRVE